MGVNMSVKFCAYLNIVWDMPVHNKLLTHASGEPKQCNVPNPSPSLIAYIITSIPAA